MKKKVLAILLTLALCLGLTPAWAAEADAAFTDVPADAWYAPYVEYVARDGVMIGTGDGAFSPGKELTQAECLTLAYRLYDLMRGQENVVEAAPEEWGYITLTVGGKTFEGYGDIESELWSWRAYNYWSIGNLEMALLTPELQEWGRTQDGGRAVCSVGGNSYEGIVECWLPGNEWVFRFVPDAAVELKANTELHTAIYRQPSPARWWRDTCYTIEKRGLTDLFDLADFRSYPAARSFFAKALYTAAGDFLDKINEVEAIPDLSRTMNGGMTDLYREQVYALYEAGILNGVDEEGNFAADKSLTRAEAAAMVARVLEPSLRIRASVEIEPPTEQLNEYEIAQRLATPEGFHFNEGMPFLDVSPELLSTLTYNGIVADSFLPTRRILRRYTAPGIEIITTQATDAALDDYLSLNRGNTELGTDEEIEAQVTAERGREWVYSVTFTVPGYSTMAGLQVGDTLERAEELGYTLYSNTGFGAGSGITWSLRADLEGGTVTQLYFLYGMGRMCGRYFDI